MVFPEMTKCSQLIMVMVVLCEYTNSNKCLIINVESKMVLFTSETLQLNPSHLDGSLNYFIICSFLKKLRNTENTNRHSWICYSDLRNVNILLFSPNHSSLSEINITDTNTDGLCIKGSTKCPSDLGC